MATPYKSRTAGFNSTHICLQPFHNSLGRHVICKLVSLTRQPGGYIPVYMDGGKVGRPPSH